MKNYKDRFTKEDLNTLREVDITQIERAYANDPEADLLTAELANKFTTLFDEYLAENPSNEVKINPDNFDEFVTYINALTEFTREVIRELLPDETGNEENIVKALVKYNHRTTSSRITDKFYFSQLRKKAAIPGQLELNIDKEGNLSITDGLNLDVLEAVVGTGIEKLVFDGREDWNGILTAKRTDLQDYLGVRIRKPTKEIIDFILTGKKPKTEAEIKLKETIDRHYTFWMDLLNWSKSKTLQTKDGSFYTLFNFSGYNVTEDSIEFDSPYFRHVYKDLKDNPVKRGKLVNNQPQYEIYSISHNVKGSSYKGKNQIALEIALELDRRIVERGIRPDSKRKPHLQYKDDKLISLKVTYEDIIRNCPKLKEKLQPKDKKEPSSAHKRDILQRAIYGKDFPKKKSKPIIEEVLTEHFVYPEKYIDFNVITDPISLKTLKEDGITITHHGLNAKYAAIGPDIIYP